MTEKFPLKIPPITLTSKRCTNIWKPNCFCVGERLFTLSTLEISAQLSKHCTMPDDYSVCRSDSSSCIGLIFFLFQYTLSSSDKPRLTACQISSQSKDSVIISPTSCFYLAKNNLASIHICWAFKNNIFATVKIVSCPRCLTQREAQPRYNEVIEERRCLGGAMLILGLGVAAFTFPADGKQSGICLFFL